MPKEYLACVGNMVEKGTPRGQAQQICAISYYKKHGVSIQEAAKEYEMSESEFLDEFALAEDALEYIAEYADYEACDLAETWKAPTARKEVPDSHFLWVKESKTGKGKIKKFPYKDADGSVNCTALNTVIRALKGARTGTPLASKYPGVMEKAENLRKTHCVKEDKEMSEGNFLTMVELTEPSDKDIVEIEMLRTGNYNHPSYGKLNVTKDKLKQMVKNFNDKVLGRDVSTDFSHEPNKGASSWIKELNIKPNERDGYTLVGTAELTEQGKSALKSKKYRYFSSTYVDDYRDKESGKSHGAAVMGGAFTNMPFIPNLKPMMFSEDIINKSREDGFDVTPFVFEDTETENVNEKLNELIALLKDEIRQGKKLDELILEVKNMGEKDTKNKDPKDPNVNIEDPANDGDKKNKKKEPTDDKSKKKDDGGGTVNLEEVTAQLKELQEANQKLSNEKTRLGDIVTKLADSNEEMSKRIKLMDGDLKIARDERFNLAKDGFLKELADKKVPPAVIETVGKYIHLDTASQVIKLDEDKNVTLMEMFKDIFANMPSSLFLSEEISVTTAPTEDEKRLGMDVDSIREDLKKMNIPVVSQ